MADQKMTPEGFEIVPASEHPASRPEGVSWCFDPLASPTDSRRKWTIGYDAAKGKIFTRYGIEGGTIQTSEVKFSVGGRSRGGDSLAECAATVVNARYKTKMHREGYTAQGAKTITAPMCMLLETFNDKKHAALVEKGVLVQPKVDGVRALVWRDADLHIYSRNRQSYDHLVPIFRKDICGLLDRMPPGAVLDGELACRADGTGATDFEATTSAVRTIEPTKAARESLMLNLFGFFISGDQTRFSERLRKLKSAMTDVRPERIRMIETASAASIEDVARLHDAFVARGFEGAVIYCPDGKYECGRSQSALKFKRFQTHEATVIGVTGGKGREEDAAKVRLRWMTDGRTVEFGARPAGSIERRKEWLAHPESIIGKQMTFKFFETTGKGVPRFPVALEIRDYE